MASADVKTTTIPISKASTVTLGLGLALLAILLGAAVSVTNFVSDFAVVSRDVSEVKAAVNEIRAELKTERQSTVESHTAIGDRLTRLESRVDMLEKRK